MKKSFTLVELIIVIAIIAVLAVISILVVSEWMGKSRDTRRLGDLNQIEKGMEVSFVANSVYPSPDNSSIIQLSGVGTTVAYQGYFGDGSLSRTSIKTLPKDPIDNSLYLYVVSYNQKSYQIMGFLEGKDKIFSYEDNKEKKIAKGSNKLYNNIVYWVNGTYAFDYTKRFPKSKGGNVPILLINSTNQPINETTGIVDINTLTANIKVISSDSGVIIGTGRQLYGIIQSMDRGSYNFAPPYTCPSGFISVPGNQQLNQPGFCVAKYEMKQVIGDAGSRNGIGGIQGPLGTAVNTYCNPSSYCNNIIGGLNGNIKGIVSKAEGFPIVALNQYNASEACKSMGDGYHLITNNEWMTIARNIERVSSNWSGGVVGQLVVNRGNSNNTNWLNGGTGALPAFSEYGRVNGAFSKEFNYKRTHTLNNGQIIWDFAGNVQEHVNRGNTIDGIYFNSLEANVCNQPDYGADGSTNNSVDWYSFSNNDGNNPCLFGGQVNINNIGPNLKINSYNGIGRILSQTNGNNDMNVSLRGGAWGEDWQTGIYSFYLGQNNYSASLDVGFRCAYLK